MIRKTTLMALLCLITFSSFAQSSRLIGYNTIRFNNGNWEPYDTARLVYNPGNNMSTSISTYNDVIKYDTTYLAGWNGTMYVPGYMKSKTYNTGGACTELLGYALYPTTELDKKTTFALDGNNNVLEELHQTWDGSNWVNSNRIIRTYNSNNDMLTQTVQYWAGSNWGNPYLYVQTFDGNHNMTSFVGTSYNTGTSQFDSTNRTETFYNSNNLADSSRSYIWNNGWELNSHTINYYGVNNINMGYLYQIVTSGNWENNQQGFTILNVNNIPIKDSTQMWNTTNNNWVNYSRGTNTLDGNNRLIEYRYEDWNTTNNSFVDNYLDSAAYNSFDQYTWFKRISWDDVTMQWYQYNDKESHYYYELYTAGIAEHQKEAGSLLLYPVPARNTLSINMQWNKAQDFVVGIYDLQGRLVRQWGEKATAIYKKTVPLNGLAGGTYILKIRGKDATVQEQFVIMD